MKSLLHASLVGLTASLLALDATAKLTRPNGNIVGKFYTSSVKGDVTVAINDRILPLKKGDSYPARGAIITTGAHSNVTLVFSNGTGLFTDEKTRFQVEKFDQEFFVPNNNLRVEPSNSSTVVKLIDGRLVINTPRLLSGTSMYYQTPHAAISIRGEKVLIEASEKQTHVAMISGQATVNPRDADGNFVSIGKRLVTGQEAFVKYTVGAHTNDDNKVADAKPAPQAPPPPSAAAASAPAATGDALVKSESGPAVTQDADALVVRLSGSTRAKSPNSPDKQLLATGSSLPKGTFIETDRDSELYLQPFTGVVAHLRPLTEARLEKDTVTKAGSTLKKQIAIIDLKVGTVVSTVDPSLHEVNDYGVRTPSGIVRAKGTSFIVTVKDEGTVLVSTTADTVAFTTTSGATYIVNAGQVVVVPPGGEPQPPISCADEVALNPAFAGDLLAALGSVTSIVQNNLGAFAPGMAEAILGIVTHTVADALPGQAIVANQPGATSVFVTQFDPSTVGDVMLDLLAAQNAQSGVQFDTEPTPNGVDLVPFSTTPASPPPDFVISPANG